MQMPCLSYCKGLCKVHPQIRPQSPQPRVVNKKKVRRNLWFLINKSPYLRNGAR